MLSFPWDIKRLKQKNGGGQCKICAARHVKLLRQIALREFIMWSIFRALFDGLWLSNENIRSVCAVFTHNADKLNTWFVK